MRLTEQIIAPTQEAFPVKKLSTQQSRRNITQRKAKVGARHAKAGHWTAQAQPMFGSGKVHYEVGGNMEAMSYGGIAPVHRLVTKLGLRSQVEKYRQRHPAFQKQLDALWERLPFAVQLRGLRPGKRFKRTVVDLRRQDLSWRQIGCIMKVSPKTVQSTWFRLKHQGLLHPLDPRAATPRDSYRF
jgi:alkylated DNA nucleotide flippase Atl1